MSCRGLTLSWLGRPAAVRVVDDEFEMGEEGVDAQATVPQREHLQVKTGEQTG